MSNKVKPSWLKDASGERIAPKTFISQVLSEDGKTLDKVLENNSAAIIDVVELPTEDIKENNFYRLFTPKMVMKDNYISDFFSVFCVNGLPETGIPFVDVEAGGPPSSSQVYYNTQDKMLYIYIDEMLSAALKEAMPELNVSIGWNDDIATLFPIIFGGSSYGGIITNLDDAEKYTVYLLLEKELYSWNDKWISYKSVGQIGEVANAEVFNNSSNTAYGIYSHAEGSTHNKASDLIMLTPEQTFEEIKEEIKTVWDENHFSLAYGEASHVEGIDCMALQGYSHAEGYRTIAEGESSHTEGQNTIAEGSSSHAEGNSSHAGGKSSHAEGGYSYAEGDDSHAEGFATYATSNCSHAEGDSSHAEGDSSHAEGYNSHAEGNSSHAEGGYSHAEGYNSHAEGWETHAEGDSSHAEGYMTHAEGDNSHAEGYNSHAESDGSHAEGYMTHAEGDFSHAEGNNSHAESDGSHAEGYMTHAEGYNSHAEGNSSHAEGDGSHAEGYMTHAEGDFSHAEGNSSHAEGDCSHAEGAGHFLQYNISGEANTTTYTFESPSDLSYLIVGASVKCYVNDNTYNTAKIINIDKDNLKIILNRTLSEDTALNNELVSIYVSGMALGDNSHSEGNKTIAAGRSQHVQGEYNIVDPEYDVNNNNKRGKYAHIVGNGNSHIKRSNAHTLDWQGNAEYQGDVVANACGGDNPVSLVETWEKVNNIPQVDWNQDDENASDYIKNRPFYGEECVVFDEEVTFVNGTYKGKINLDFKFRYKVIINDEICTENGQIIYDDPDYYMPVYLKDGSRMDFCSNGWVGYNDVDSTYSIKIIDITNSVFQKIDEKYIPSTIARQKALSKLSEDKQDKNVIVNITKTVADGVTTYSADKTFVEIESAIAEGKEVIAKFNATYLHMVQHNVGTNMYFHMFNRGNIMSVFYEITKNDNVNVYIDYIQGTSNKVDALDSDSTYTQYPSAKAVVDYVEEKFNSIVDGNAEFAGDVIAYGCGKENPISLVEIANDLNNKITAPLTAEVGQILSVKAVDENGKPIEWETISIEDIANQVKAIL